MISNDKLKKLIEKHFGSKVVCYGDKWQIYYGYGTERFQCKLENGAILNFSHKNNVLLLTSIDMNVVAYLQEDIDNILAFNEEIN